MRQAIYGMDRLQEGQQAVVHSFLAQNTMRRRLRDIGLIEGTMVQCLQKSPFGDPTAYFIRGAVIALRAEDAKKVLIQYAQ